MKLLKLMVLTLAVASLATAMPIVGLYSTGMNVSGGVDQSWQLGGGNAYVTQDGQFPFGAWVANDANAKWVSPQANYVGGGGALLSDANGVYTYTTTFDLTGYDPTTANFNFTIAADDRINSVYLNSNQLVGVIGPYAGGAMSGPFGPGVGNGFVAGLNTITVSVQNMGGDVGNPTGLRLEVLNSDVEMLQAIPEPATFALVGLALAALPLVRRRKR
ncbi:MAG: hypothetical protein C0504_01880 [Candidatus Solibacter sp.]|nr:hypothetical protein [Candidatus Solibacter sp.]